jgi:hypothetical protein
LYALPHTVGHEATTSKQALQIWAEVDGRNIMAGGLIIDDKPGMLNQMIERTYPGMSKDHPEFGEEILHEAEVLFKGNKP